MQTNLLDELPYADGMVKNASTERKMPAATEAYDKYGLKFSMKKTATIYQPAPGNLCSFKRRCQMSGVIF